MVYSPYSGDDVSSIYNRLGQFSQNVAIYNSAGKSC